ncbi:adenosylcobinamide-GDP ribazoletransferase [Thermoplasma volcanium]|nr:adenosylcobinamide-GDP ribazoletransferase [Thermoplasma volcanium]
MISGLRSSFSFFTLVPSRQKDIGNPITFLPLVVTVGALIGDSILYITWQFSHLIASFLSISSIIIYNGLNHFDATADLGDALMVRDKSRIPEVIKDHHVGAGGIFAVIFVYGIAVLSLARSTLYIGLVGILIGQVVSGSSMMISLIGSQPFVPGLADYFISLFRKHSVGYTIEFLAIPIIVSFIFSPLYVVIVALNLLIVQLTKTMISRRFGGINGDVIGFLGEFSRSLFIFMLIIIAHYNVASTYDIFSKMLSSFTS